MQHDGFLGYSIAACQAGRTTDLLLQHQMKRWRIKSSSYPNSKKQTEKKPEVGFGCLASLYFSCGILIAQ